MCGMGVKVREAGVRGVAGWVSGGRRRSQRMFLMEIPSASPATERGRVLPLFISPS